MTGRPHPIRTAVDLAIIVAPLLPILAAAAVAVVVAHFDQRRGHHGHYDHEGIPR